MHHFNVESLTACFHSLDRRKAVGTDKVDKEIYGSELNANLESLIGRMRQMSYRPRPVREVLIPKEGKPGAVRPLGISNFEDKIVQGMMRQILESIYEPLFLDCSYGFRPGRGCHDAIRDLRNHIAETNVRFVIDVDLANYFGSISHRKLEEILLQKITDQTFMRYIVRMFKAGILAEGELQVSEEGVPQGSICSPVLANIFAHYVIDEWFENTVKRHCAGRVRLFRYCDDFVICCERRDDAERIRTALSKRLERFGLKLNDEKTKLESFNRFDHARGQKQGHFTFLGFTFFIGRSRNGKSIPKLRTNGARLRAKLSRVTEWAKGACNRFKLPDIWRVFRAKIQGHINYYSVSFNMKAVRKFVWKATQILYKWLNRRSQRKSFTLKQFDLFTNVNPLPKIVVKHSLIRQIKVT